MLFRDILAHALAEKQMTQAKLADRIQGLTGKEIEESVISKYVNGTYRPRKTIALVICKELELNFQEIWAGIEAERTVDTKFHRLARYMWDDLDLDHLIDRTTRQLIKSERQKSANAFFRRLLTSSVTDIDWILGFDHGIYPTNKPVTRCIMQSWLEAENKFSFTLKGGSEIFAYCVALPVSPLLFDKLLHGKFAEADLPVGQIGIQHKCLYIYSNMARGPYYAGEMLARLVFLYNIHRMKSLGGLIVTPEEERLAERLGLKRVWRDKDFPSPYKPTTYVGTPATCAELRNLLKHYGRYVEIMRDRF